MFKQRKYEIVGNEYKISPDGESLKLYRIKALIDIPLHNVKAGDLGGWVSNKKILSHEGNAWIGGEAFAVLPKGYDNGNVSGDALVTDNAYLHNSNVSGDALVTDSAYLHHSNLSGHTLVSDSAYLWGANISGDAIVTGDARLSQTTINSKCWIGDNVDLRSVDTEHQNSNLHLSGNVKIFYTSLRGDIKITGDCDIKNDSQAPDAYSHKPSRGLLKASENEKIDISGKVNISNSSISGNVLLQGKMDLVSVTMSGNNEIIGEPQIMPKTTFTGTNVLRGECLVPPGTHAHNVIMNGGVFSYENGINNVQQAIAPVALNAEAQEYIDLIHDIQAEYDSYTTDIVKLIKYPAMVDLSIPEIQDLALQLRTAQRAVKSTNVGKLEKASENLEKAFLRAENKATTLVDSHLDDTNKKSLKDAGQMFKLACDEGRPNLRSGWGSKPV